MAQINKPNQYFNTKLYTGNGTTNAITGVGFQPDFTWNKGRNDAWNHSLVDSVRGVTKVLRTDTTEAEEVRATNLTSFDTDGFTLGSDALVNTNGDTLASWNWKANGTGVANTDGTITSTVSANTTSGFSIVKWTGTGSGLSNVTIGHGLGAVPKVVLFKQLDTGNWVVYHQAISKDNYLVLNTTDASASATGLCNPTSTNIVLETSYGGTNSTGGMIAYCFAEKQGYSKFSSYVGNGGNQFIYTGFKPAFVIEKRSSSISEWDMYDNKRNTFNSVTKVLKPNASDAEVTYGGLNFLSNGFEAKGSLNDSGQTLIYMAFAENPLVGTNNIPATAR